jgi:predicted CopG family antitoxin
MERITTIQIEVPTKEKLEKLKVHERESYNEVIERVLKGSKNKRIDEESLKETIEILSDPETLREIAGALIDYEKGKFIELK